MKTSLITFPFKGKSTDYPTSDYKTALEWKEKFEYELLKVWIQLEDFRTNLDSVQFINKAVQNAQLKGEILQIKEMLGLNILDQLKEIDEAPEQVAKLLQSGYKQSDYKVEAWSRLAALKPIKDRIIKGEE